jgi:enoyl-[acyl-carrier protein] reductase II
MNKVTELLKIKYPIIQGAMASISTHKLVAAVSNAGGLGVLAASMNDPTWVREEIKKTKALTDKPFAVNVLLLSPHASEIAKIVVEEGVKIVTTGGGSPQPYMDDWKKADIVVIPVVANVALARRMERAGADMIIAEGREAGGHVGPTSTFSLIPQVVKAVNIPVIAAGGIGNYQGVAAALALGAKGVQAGTIFLASLECPIHQNYKELIIKAKDTSTVVTGKGRTEVRILKNKLSNTYLEMLNSGASIEELEALTKGSLRKAIVDGSLDEGSFMAGEVSGLISEIKPVKEIIEDLILPVNDYLKTLKI